MIPIISFEMVRLDHEERIKAARRPVPEWTDSASLVVQPGRGERVRRRVRGTAAGLLRRLAAALDPQPSFVSQ
jgi:hypothetical protein